MKSGSVLLMDPPRLSRGDDGTCRVSACVDGHEVFFESPAELEPSPEAFLSAFLLPAMARGRDLRIEAPVCGTWRQNVETVQDWARRWWSLSGGRIEHQGVRDRPKSAGGRALFFGGGVDSCFALYDQREDLDYLVNTQGFDIKITDHPRLARTLERNRRVADACGVQLLTVRTNLRQHPAFRRLHWLKAYGGALAATGHLLSPHCDHFLLSGWGLVVSRTRGSHPEIDSRWSSAAVSFEHHGETHSRAGKVLAIADWPVAHEYVRVCYENRSQELNCGGCEKCIRTRLEFLVAGRSDEMIAFPPLPLATQIDRIAGLAEHVAYNYEELLEGIGDPEIRASIQRLLARSPKWRARKQRVKNIKSAIRRYLPRR